MFKASKVLPEVCGVKLKDSQSCGIVVGICENYSRDDSNIVVLPGLIDVHVHLRQPGYLYKETVATGTAAGARGGYTALCSMPNLSPAPDSPENLEPQLEAIKLDAKIPVYPYGTITEGRAGKTLSQMEAIAPNVIGFSDDGSDVRDSGLMREAMARAAQIGLPIAAHCEDTSVIGGKHVNEGVLSKKLGIEGISRDSEWRQVERDLKLADETGVRYHVCHISCRETVALIRDAKKSGVDVTCETGPHYLVLDDSMAEDDGAYKMNPPLRAKEDRLALIDGIVDGTIDMIATDHAPHSQEEKSKGLIGSMFGIVGLETAFPVCYTNLVMEGIVSLEKLVELMSTAPTRRFGIDNSDCYSVFDLSTPFTIDKNKFLSMGRSTPFHNKKVYGSCKAVISGGKLIYAE